MTKKLNLHNYRSNGSRIFSGRDKGCNARKELKLGVIDFTHEEIIILIPKDTWAINSSFFGGLFEASVISLGEENFRKKYKFLYADGTELSYELQQNINEGIFDALNDI